MLKPLVGTYSGHKVAETSLNDLLNSSTKHLFSNSLFLLSLTHVILLFLFSPDFSHSHGWTERLFFLTRHFRGENTLSQPGIKDTAAYPPSALLNYTFLLLGGKQV